MKEDDLCTLPGEAGDGDDGEGGDTELAEQKELRALLLRATDKAFGWITCGELALPSISNLLMMLSSLRGALEFLFSAWSD